MGKYLLNMFVYGYVLYRDKLLLGFYYIYSIFIGIYSLFLVVNG